MKPNSSMQSAWIAKHGKYVYALVAGALALAAHQLAVSPPSSAASAPPKLEPMPLSPSPAEASTAEPAMQSEPSPPVHRGEVLDRWKALEAENAALRQVQSDLQHENLRLQEQLRSVLQWILDNFRGRYPIPEHLVSRLQVCTLNDDFTVHDEFAALLRLSPDERDRLDEAFRAAHEMTLAIYADVLRATVPSPTELVLEIPPHQEQGETVRQQIREALRTVLGEVRSPWAEAAATHDLARRFGYFGRGLRTIRFQLVESEDGSEPRIRIRDEYAMEDLGGERTVTIREFAADRLSRDYESLLQLLPSP